MKTSAQSPDADALTALFQQHARLAEELDPNEVWHFDEGTLNHAAGMGWWLPKLEGMRVPIPETVFVPVPERCNLVRLLDGEEPLHFAEFMEGLKAAVEHMRQSRPEAPGVFLRTAYTSGKHDWKNTCMLPRATGTDDLKKHLVSLVNYSAMADLPVDLLAVRELVPVRPAFHAFEGMPIASEWRLRVVDGSITHIQPYWPEEAFARGWDKPVDIPQNWQEALHGAWRISFEDCAFLKAKTEEIGKRLAEDGTADWSVDWMRDASGRYVCIDLAPGPLSYWWEADEASFVDPPCEDSPEADGDGAPMP